MLRPLTVVTSTDQPVKAAPAEEEMSATAPSKARDFMFGNLSKIGKRYKIETRPFFQTLQSQSSPKN